MSRSTNLLAQNVASAVRRFASLGADSRESLRVLTTKFSLSVAGGDLTLINGRWYVTHSGLLQLAHRNRCSGIETKTVPQFCDPPSGRWVVKATVFKTSRSKGFVGYGDADPTNVSSLVRGAELRIAETRAVNRALRKAYGIGICSIEELGAGATIVRTGTAADGNGGIGKGQPRLRDRLLLLIRQYRLDAEQVKRYAARFCGTNSLREATREQVEAFIDHLASRAAKDRDKLVAEMHAADEQFDVANGRREEISGDKKTEAA